MVDNSLKFKIASSIDMYIKVLGENFKDLEDKADSKQKLTMEFKEGTLDTIHCLEVALYRAKMYNIAMSRRYLIDTFQNFNHILNSTARKDVLDYEYVEILNYKMVSILTFIIDHII